METSNSFACVKGKLEENIQLAKPNRCHSPSETTYILQQTEDQLDTSIFSTDTGDYDTASSCCDVGDIDTDLDDFLMAEKMVDLLSDLPEENDQLLFWNEQGRLQRITSVLKRMTNAFKSDVLDCAAQINSQQLSDDISAQLSKLSISSSADEGESTTVNMVVSGMESIQEISKDNTENSIKSVSMSPQLHINQMERNSEKQAFLSRHMTETQFSELTGDGNKKGRSLSKLDELSESILHTPVKELSPKIKKEISSLLLETAQALDLSQMSMDESLSSMQLLHSIILEASKMFGLSESSWVTCMASACGLDTKLSSNSTSTIVPTSSFKTALSEGNTLVDISNNTGNLDKSKSSHFHTYRTPAETPTASGSLKTAVNTKSSSKNYVPASQLPDDVKSEYLSVDTLTQLGNNTNKDSLLHTSCSYTLASGDIIHKTNCQPPESEDYFTCRQVQDTKGVKTSFKSLSKNRHCRSKLTGKAERKNIPCVKEFKISTKSGAHNFLEILKARLLLPKQDDKKVVVGPTVPVPLLSEAVWRNGELNIVVKETGKDLIRLPTNKKLAQSVLPHSVNIEFVREYKENKGKQRSPVILRRAIQEQPLTSSKANSPTTQRPFNTKVDYIFKKEPLVLGTIDQRKFSKKQLINQTRARRSRLPAYCIV